MKPARRFEDLIVWRKAHEFVLWAYRFSASFPVEETYGLKSQLRRAAGSVPANIAEGFRRQSKPDKARFMNIAQSSVEECRYYLILAGDLDYGKAQDGVAKIEEVGRILESYCSSIVSSG